MTRLLLVRKGQLKENTVEVLVAVIILVVVFTGAGYLLYKYFQLTNIQNEDEAKGLLRVLDAKMGALKDGEQGNFLLRGPCEGEGGNSKQCNWYLTGWGKEDDNRPQRCFFKSCVCVCRVGGNPATLVDKDVVVRDACQDGQTGFCSPVNVVRVKVSSVQQQIPDFPVVVEGVPIRPAEERPAISKSFIPFKSNLIELKMQRSADQLEITLV